MLKVLIAGTGFAAEGHTDAFRAAGADVVGMVGRSESVVKEGAGNKDIAYCGTSWTDALEICKPTIVSIATPGGAHFEPIKQAIELGCHVFCEKPMTDNGDSANKLYELAEAANIKTAYAVSFRYSPSILHAKQLIQAGAIGEPTEVECISHFNLERAIPFGWSHRIDAGGGRLNNNLTHTLSIVSSVIGDKFLSILGDVRDDLGKAPMVKGVHNFMTRREFIPTDLKDPSLEWGESDVEWSYTVQAQIQSPFASKPVSVLFKHGGLVPRFNKDHIVFYGREGAIYVEGHYGTGQLHLWEQNKQWVALPTPKAIADSVPDIKGDTEQCWHYMIREFVKDIRGESVESYPTFREGRQYQQLIDIIRKNSNWTDISHLN